MSAAARYILTVQRMRALIFIMPIILYLVSILHFSVNIPHYDDYPLLLGFLNQYKNIGTMNDFLGILFSQVAEYKIAFAKIVAVSDYTINGNLSFVRLIIISNIALFMTFVLIYVSSNIEKGYKMAALLPLPYFFFQLQYWESSTWAIVALDHFFVFFFSLLCIYLLNRNARTAFLLALLVSIITPFTSPNGLFLFVVGFFLLAAQKKFKSLLIWSLLSIGVFLLYFINYQASETSPGIMQRISEIPNLIVYMLSLMGSSCGFGLKYPSIIFGLFFFLWFCYLHYRKYYHENPVVYYFTLFLLLSCAAAAAHRSGYGIDIYLYTGRYRLLSTLIIACTFVSYAELFGRAKQSRTIFIGAVFFLSLSYLLYLPFISGRYEELRSGVNGLSNTNHCYAYRIVQEASQNGIYHLPAGYLDKIDPNYVRDEKIKLHNFAARFNERDSGDTTLTLRINIPQGNLFDTRFNVFLQKHAVIYLFNSRLTPTTIRESLHNVNPDHYKSDICIKKDTLVPSNQNKEGFNVGK